MGVRTEAGGRDRLGKRCFNPRQQETVLPLAVKMLLRQRLVDRLNDLPKRGEDSAAFHPRQGVRCLRHLLLITFANPPRRDDRRPIRQWGSEDVVQPG